MPVFDGSEKVIGRGAQAVVYLWRGYAYKVYPDQYPREWIEHELHVQEEICKTDLPVVKYEKTDNPGMIRMDYIDGMTLADRIRKKQYKYGVEDMIKLQKTIHMIEKLQLPDMKQYAIHDLEHMEAGCAQKRKALAILDLIPEKNHLLHFDFHFLNILYAADKYFVIDWINARMGHPVYDFARSYVILNEFTDQMARRYFALINHDASLHPAQLKMAIYVEALLRLRERTSDATLKLIQELDDDPLLRI